MTILVDIDSTITNFGKMLLNACNSYYKTNYQYKEITSYDWFDKTFKDPWFVADCFSFWDSVTVNPEAIHNIESWAEQKHEILLVTASHFNSTLGYKIKKTLEPFNSKLINERNIIIAQNKSVIKGDVMIDDYIGNLMTFSGTRICYSQPWNKYYNGSLKFSDWNKINETINAIQAIYFEDNYFYKK